MTAIQKKYGLILTLRKQDPLCLPHLLGDHFSHTHWFASPLKRDQFLQKYQKQHQYYRLGDLTRYEYQYTER